MTTARDLINLSLKTAGVIGVGQTALAEDINDAFTQLNWMMGQWRRKRWLVYHLVDVTKVSTGATSYTIGPSGDFNVTARPDRIEAAFFRQLIQSQPNRVDYPLKILQSREDYNRIALKQLGSFPQTIWYDSAFPLGVLYPWPVPAATIYEFHLSLKEILPQFATLSTTITLPEEYYAALHLNLVPRIWTMYGREADPVVIALAKDALNVIRGANTQIATLSMPDDVVRTGKYNIYSDTNY